MIVENLDNSPKIIRFLTGGPSKKIIAISILP